MVQASDITTTQKADILTEALPFLRRYAGHSFVIKYGGNAMTKEVLKQGFARDIALLQHIGIRPVVVHGGGPQIGSMLNRLGAGTKFIDGLRVTDSDTVKIVEMVLAGSVNKEVVRDINAAGATAVGICGKDGNLMRARKLTRKKKIEDSPIEQVLDLGFVGEPTYVDPTIITAFQTAGLIPVIAPIAICEDQGFDTYNVNGDTASGAIAAAIGATRMLLLTDVRGVLNKDGALIPELTPERARELIADGTISGGMIPKVETCLAAVEAGVEGAVIVDGREKHASLLEIFTSEGTGTLFRAAPTSES